MKGIQVLSIFRTFNDIYVQEIISIEFARCYHQFKSIFLKRTVNFLKKNEWYIYNAFEQISSITGPVGQGPALITD